VNGLTGYPGSGYSFILKGVFSDLIALSCHATPFAMLYPAKMPLPSAELAQYPWTFQPPELETKLLSFRNYPT
jgi:hypothetical protein